MKLIFALLFAAVFVDAKKKVLSLEETQECSKICLSAPKKQVGMCSSACKRVGPDHFDLSEFLKKDLMNF